jgi:peptidoglycan lytic transglycosylase D
MKTMLSFKLPGAIFFSILLLLITLPAVSFNGTTKIGLSQECIDSASAPKTPLNKQATQFVKKYHKQNDESLGAVKQKAGTCFATIDGVFTEYGLPVELKYLAVVESELNPKAVSKVGAVGTWQLMPATARILGLKITRKIDERKNIKKSTRAAAIYLRDLYFLYEDWLLVIAAYNCGPAPVNAAIRKTGSRNFWKLQYLLPAESRDHVKKYIATHYYFEGEGGITTLTKAENIKYAQTMARWAATREKTNTASAVATDSTAITDTTRRTIALNQ